MHDTKCIKSKLNKFYDVIPDWCWSIYCFFRNCKRHIADYIAWASVIWRDRDWDAAYLYEIMRFKISRMRRELDKNKRHYGVEQNVLEMKRAEFLLERLACSDFYFDNNERYKDFIGKCTCPEETIEMRDFPDRSGGEIIFHHCEMCDKGMRYWFKRADRKKQDDLEYTFKYISKHSPKWWD